jgi:hypothetical protein
LSAKFLARKNTKIIKNSKIRIQSSEFKVQKGAVSGLGDEWSR